VAVLPGAVGLAEIAQRPQQAQAFSVVSRSMSVMSMSVMS
jgi:hypothetical protein